MSRWIRHSSTDSGPKLARILVFPITRDKSYLHFQYNKELVNNNSLLVKCESKAVQIATKGWNSLKSSEKSYNKKIVHWLNVFLERIPWSEDSLRSIPSQSALLRQVRKNEKEKEAASSESAVTGNTSEEVKFQIASNETDGTFEGIKVLYPSKIVTSETLSREIEELCGTAVAYHRKQMLWTATGIPLSLPIALVPLVPNVPGFYLAYRFYCNYKAATGGQHLKELSTKNELIYEDTPSLDDVYESVREQDGELLLNESVIDSLVDLFNVPEAKLGLSKALKQEQKKVTN